MKVLLDMDGVIADFIGGICEYHKRDNPYAKGEGLGEFRLDRIWGMTYSKFWGGVGYEFWSDLAPTKEAMEIVATLEEAVGRENICILTHPPDYRYAEAVDGKLEWLRRHFPDYHNRVIFGKHKEFCAGPNTILVDDCDSNIGKFREAGGYGIIIDRPWNSCHASEDNLVNNLKENLAEIFETRTGSRTWQFPLRK